MTDAEQFCPSCAEGRVEWRKEFYEFDYGVGEDAAKIEAEVPVGTCTTCDFEFTDWRGEASRHEAVCRHLGVLTPSEVRAVRERRGLSATELALAIGVDVDRVESLERGASVQSVAHDALLRKMADQSVEGEK